jgi:hypothetical protein
VIKKSLDATQFIIDVPAISFKPGEPISELLSGAAVSEALVRHRADLSINTYPRNKFPFGGSRPRGPLACSAGPRFR